MKRSGLSANTVLILETVESHLGSLEQDLRNISKIEGLEGELNFASDVGKTPADLEDDCILISNALASVSQVAPQEKLQELRDRLEAVMNGFRQVARDIANKSRFN